MNFTGLIGLAGGRLICFPDSKAGKPERVEADIYSSLIWGGTKNE